MNPTFAKPRFQMFERMLLRCCMSEIMITVSYLNETIEGYLGHCSRHHCMRSDNWWAPIAAHALSEASAFNC